MIESYFEGFLLGIGAAIPLGPINILIMNKALRRYKSGVFLGFGAMSADVFYLLLVFIGLIGFLMNPLTLKIVGIFGSLFLLYLAYSIYKNADKILKLQEEVGQTKKILSTYAQGFLLTLLNPMTIIFWLSIAGYVANRNLNIELTIMGMMTSIGLWISIMPYIIHRAKHKLSQSASNYLNIFSALILFCFGVMLLVESVI